MVRLHASEDVPTHRLAGTNNTRWVERADTGGFSLLAGNTYGRVIGIIAGTLGAIGALLSVGGSYPWWSLGIFALA